MIGNFQTGLSRTTSYSCTHAYASGMSIQGGSSLSLASTLDHNQITYSDLLEMGEDNKSAEERPAFSDAVEDEGPESFFPEVEIKEEPEQDQESGNLNFLDTCDHVTLQVYPGLNNKHHVEENKNANVDIDHRRMSLILDPLCPRLVRAYLQKLRMKKTVTMGESTQLSTSSGRPPIKKQRIVSRKGLDENSDTLQTSENKFVHPLKISFELAEGRWNARQPISNRLSGETGTAEAPVIRKRGRPKKAVVFNENSGNDSGIPEDLQLESFEDKQKPRMEPKKAAARKQAKSQVTRRKKRTLDEPADSENPPLIGPCVACNLKFHTDEELTSHSCCKYYELPNGRFQCGVCPKSLSRKKEMPAHLRRHTGEKPFPCQYCGKKFMDKRNRRVHEKSKAHENERNFKCRYCPHASTSSSGKLAHEAIHGELKFSCDVEGCSKVYRTKTYLAYHTKSHSNETVHCKFCSKGIKLRNFNRHQQRCQNNLKKEEEAIAPFIELLSIPLHQNGIYTCDACRIQFKSELSYSTHECARFCKLGEGTWRCGVCFKIKKVMYQAMKQHMKYHDPRTHYFCQVCEKGFRYESERNRHVDAHDSVKKFLCPSCGASYTGKQRFVEHLRKKHPEVPIESLIQITTRTGEGRKRDKVRQERPGYQKRKRGHNKRTLVPGVATTNMPLPEPEPEINRAYEKNIASSTAPALVPISVPSTNPHPSISHAHRQPGYQIQQPYSNYTGVPPEHIIPNDRQRLLEWQTAAAAHSQMQMQSFHQVHNYQTFFQYQHQAAPTQMYIPSSNSAASSGPSESDVAAANSQSQDFEDEMEAEPEELPDPDPDWDDDDLQDPWETAFEAPWKPTTKVNSRTERAAKPRTVTQEVLPEIDESGLFTKVARKEWICNHCDRTSNRRSQIISHCRVHTGSKPFSCPECDHKFKDKRNLSVHMRVHSGSKPYQCPVCFIRFRHNAPFNVHKRTHGDLLLTVPPLPQPPRIERPKKQKLELAKIKLTERERVSAKELFESIDDALPFRCELCCQTYAFEGELNEHACPKYAPLENGFWKCGICHKICRRRSEMKGHLAVHLDICDFVCDQCGKGFKCKRSLTRHQAKSHLGVTKLFYCSICNKEFTTHYNKEIHERKHRQEMPFLCSTCGLRFYDKQSHKNHVLRHEAGGPTFKCSVCGTELTTRKELSRHGRDHGIIPKQRMKKSDCVSASNIPKPRTRAAKAQREKAKSEACITLPTSVIKEEPNSASDSDSEDLDSNYSYAYDEQSVKAEDSD